MRSDDGIGLEAAAVRSRPWIAGALPLIALVQVYLFIFVVRASMGTWPDPGTLPQPLYAWDAFAGWSLIAAIVLSPLAALAALVAAVTRHRTIRNAAAAFAVSGVLVYLILLLDRSYPMIWYWD